MKARIVSRKLVLYSALGICGIIGLLVFAYSVIHMDAMQRESMRDYYETEMYASLDCFIRDLENEDSTLAYHHAKYAADYASMCGLSAEAEMFGSISARVLNGEMTADMAEQVKYYIETGEVRVSNERRSREDVIMGSLVEVPLFVNVSRYKAAKDTTDKLFGGGNIINRMEKIRSGELLFLCENAYAIIDERSALPIEAGLSLDVGEITMSEEEYISAAKEFLLSFYSEDTVKNGYVQSITPDMENGVVNIDYMLGTRRVALSVKGDNGRVVGFVGR